MKKLEKNLEGISNIKLFTSAYNWEGIKYPSEKDDGRKFEKEMEFCPAYISKQFKLQKNNYSFNDFKLRRLALSCSKKTTRITKRSSLKT